MCSICHMSPCPAGCPNAPDPPGVTTCVRCGEAVRVGEEYARIDGLDYCKDCIEDMPYSELVELMGGEWRSAHEEDIYDGYDG